jgi:hypothetical protein
MGRASRANRHASVREVTRSLRRALALILVVVTATGCTKSVEIPRDQIGDAPEANPGYRIDMVDGSHYTVKRFSIVDSTIVIEKLNPSDSRHKDAKLPIVLSISDVQSISKLETRSGLSFAVTAVVGVLAILFVAFLYTDFPWD